MSLAVATGAQYLIIRDEDLLELMDDAGFPERFPDLTILDPVALLREMTPARNPDRTEEPPR